MSKGMKDGLDRLATAVWQRGFAWGGRWRRSRVTPWQPVGGQRILVIAPHPDDESVGCAGTILSHVAAGDAVCLLFVTDGRQSRALGLPAAEMAQRRQAEAGAVADRLGVGQWQWWGLPEGNWTTAQFQAALRPFLDTFGADIIYAPSRVDFHPEHYQVAWGVAGCVSDGVIIRVYPVQVPLTAVLTNVIVDVSRWSAEITAVFNLYQTQRDSLVTVWRQRHYAALYYQVGEQVETFWQMTGRQYGRLHQVPLREWWGRPFRGMRYRSFTDPWAYGQGYGARRQLRRLVQQP